MADLTASCRTTLAGEDVIVRAVQFFTNDRWRVQSQSARVATLIGRPKIPVSTAFLLGSLGSLLLAGCGGSGSSSSGGGGTPPPTATVTSVSVSCASATVNVGQTSQCSATVQGTGNYSSAVTWSVNSVAGGNATVGTVSTAGLYTAPSLVPNPGTVTVSATSSADSSKSATAALKIKLSISVSPQNATIELFHPQQFTSTISGVTNTSVAWAINGVAGGNPNIGQITATGLYTPPVSLPSPASITVTATSQADTTQSASATAALITDTTALSVTSVSPASNATSVSVQTPVSITFNEAVDPSTVSTGSISLSEGGTIVPARYSYDATANTVTLTPLVLLDPQAVCTITVGTLLHDLGGNPLATAYTSSFTIEAPLSLTGNLTPPSGIDPASLTVLSFQGQQSPADSNGNFTVSTSPVGTTLISAMFSAEASGLMAIAISDTSTSATSAARLGPPASATSGSMEINPFLTTTTAKPLVQIRTHQITASTAKASSTGGLVLDFQTTAEAVLFLSPALYRKDPQGATTIMTAIAADPNTQALVSALSQAWNEAHPLQDTNVSVAYTTALSSILTTLIQQSGSATPSVATSTSESEKATSSHAVANSQQTGAVATSLSYHSIDSCCVNVGLFAISGQNYISMVQVNGLNLLPEPGFSLTGNAAGWAMRVVPLAPNFNPGTLQPVNGNSENPDSPGPVTGENTPDNTIAQEIPMPPVSWIPGNSVLQYGDIYGDINKIASWITGLFGVQNPTPNPQPNIVLPQVQPAFYLVRYFSGGTADSNETPLVANPYNPNSPLAGGIYDQQLWGGALIANYASAISNVVLVGQASDTSTCLASGIINDGTIAQSVLNISPGTSTNWNGFQQVASTILSGLANNLPQCIVNAGEQQAFAMTLDAAGLSSGVGEIVDGISGAAEVGDAAQMMAELFAKDSPVDTAYIWVSPPSPSSAASVAISPSTLALTVGGNATLTATAYDGSQNAIPNTPFTWTSSNQGVVQISGSGGSANVTAVSMGNATVTATTPNGAQGPVTVTVSAPQAQNLPAPTLLAPANGATGISATPTFSWSAVTGSAGYRLLVGTSAAALPTNPQSGACGGCIVDAAISGTSYTPSSTLSGGVPYYWEVHALTPVSNPGYGA
ncbi:MAG: Ig-like domain-containing protein [Acidobacteriaceae bacterium]